MHPFSFRSPEGNLATKYPFNTCFGIAAKRTRETTSQLFCPTLPCKFSTILEVRTENVQHTASKYPLQGKIFAAANTCSPNFTSTKEYIVVISAGVACLFTGLNMAQWKESRAQTHVLGWSSRAYFMETQIPSVCGGPNASQKGSHHGLPAFKHPQSQGHTKQKISGGPDHMGAIGASSCHWATTPLESAVLSH